MDPKPEEDADLLEEMPSRSQPSAQTPPSASSAGPSAGRIRSKNCDVRGCGSNSLRNPELLFVAVPGQNAPERRFVWLTLMQAIRDKKRSYVCSRHFAVPEDFKDFHEFITAPPGYKRQLLVKRGVVPHFNMPPLNIPGLPPLNDHWQLTLPVGMTETDQIRQARISEMFGGGHLQGPTETSVASNNRTVDFVNQQASTVKCAAKAVQTETVFSGGQRKMQASLQYCRLCLQRQDLEPIFTGDQTLIEPDLIDKIYGCTQILITVENDFPSSICTNCYQNVQHFITFRRSVQKNDQSLRSTAATIGTFKPAPCPPLPVPTSSSPAPVTAVPARTKTIGKVTPMRPVPTAAAPVRASLASPQCPGIVPLAPWSMPKSQTVQQQQAAPQRPRVYAPQRTIIRKLPLDQSKDTSGNAADIDPFANVEESSVAGWDNQQAGVQMADRVVPVTLIRVQPEQEAQEEEEDDEVVEVPNEPIQTQPEEDNSRRNFLQPKPLEQLLENARNSATETEPEVLQAVELIPSAVAQEVVKQRNAPKIFLRKAPVPSKRLSPVSTLSKVKDTPKFSTVPKVVRAVKFPGTLTTLFSGVRKPSKPLKSTASPELTKFKAVISPKPVESPKPASPAPEEQKPAPQPKPKAPTPTAQVLKEVKVPGEPPKAPTRPKPKLLPSTKPKQKENEPTRPKPKQNENDIPESPQSETSTVPEVTSPRSARTRKVPAKFQDTVGFPMPKIVIKPDPDAEQTPRAKLPEVKSASELPELRVRVQDARARLSAGKQAEVSPAPKTRLSAGKTQTPMVPKEPEKKVQAVKVKEVEKKPLTPVSKPKEPVKTVAKSKEADKRPVPVPPSKPKEVEKKPSKIQIAVKAKDMRGRPSKEAPPEEPPARSAKRKSIPDAKESPRTKRASLETAPAKVSKPAKTPAPAAPVTTPAPRASACPFCSNRTFDEKKALVKHLRKRHGMDYATVRQRLAIYGGNW